MKRGLVRRRIYFFIFIIFLVFFIDFSLAQKTENFFKLDLSPFFPDYSPFNVSVSIKQNSPPIILDLQNEIFVCENHALSAYFNVSDVDGDALNLDINPKFPFFCQPYNYI